MEFHYVIIHAIIAKIGVGKQLLTGKTFYWFVVAVMCTEREREREDGKERKNWRVILI